MVHNTDASLYLRTTEDDQSLTALQEHLATLCATVRAPNKVVKDDCVCALRNGVWERARVVGLVGDACQLLFVDIGCRSEAVDRTQLRPLPQGAGQMPAMALEVKLDGVTQLKDCIVSPLRGKVFFAERLSNNEGSPPTVRIFNNSGECISDLLCKVGGKRSVCPFCGQ